MISGARLKISGVNQHKIYKLALKNNINLQNIEKFDYKTLFFDVSATKIKNIIAICEKNNYNVSIVKRYGFLLAFEILKQKIGLFIGGFLLIVLSIFSTNFVWQVKVYGVSEKNQKHINNVLENLNIKTFAPKNKHKIKLLETEILKSVKGVSQVSVIIKGTTVIVNIKEAILKEDVLGENWNDWIYRRKVRR